MCGPHNESDRSDEILKKFSLLPAKYANHEVRAKCVLESSFCTPPFARQCKALGLSIGNTLTAKTTIASLGCGLDLYALGELAESLLPLRRGAEIEARVRTAFGLDHEIVYGPDGPIDHPYPQLGLVVIEVLSQRDAPDSGADAMHSAPRSLGPRT